MPKIDKYTGARNRDHIKGGTARPIIVAEKKPRWSILVRRKMEHPVVRTISLVQTGESVLQMDRAVVLVHLDSFGIEATIDAVLKWNNTPTDPILLTTVDDGGVEAFRGPLVEAGIQDIFVGLIEFERFKRRVQRSVMQ